MSLIFIKTLNNNIVLPSQLNVYSRENRQKFKIPFPVMVLPLLSFVLKCTQVKWMIVMIFHIFNKWIIYIYKVLDGSDHKNMFCYLPENRQTFNQISVMS